MEVEGKMVTLKAEQPKPGYKTTEFWLTLLAQLLAMVVASGLLGITETEADDKVVAGIISILSFLGYTASRTVTKVADIKGKAIALAAKNSPAVRIESFTENP